MVAAVSRIMVVVVLVASAALAGDTASSRDALVRAKTTSRAALAPFEEPPQSVDDQPAAARVANDALTVRAHPAARSNDVFGAGATGPFIAAGVPFILEGA
ncbi:MAG: hypothetical protein IAE78_07660 [Myxococcus sp.]|nr:hypothetical protein [Myxococcus sp.]